MSANAINAWIPIASALVSAGAVLVGGLLTSRHARNMKILELYAASALQRRTERRQAGERAYKALQMLAKLSSRSVREMLRILDRTVELSEGISSLAAVKAEVAELDTIEVRFILETYFPGAHLAWKEFETEFSKSIELSEFLSDNLDALKNSEDNSDYTLPDYESYRELPKALRRTMHRVCRLIVDAIVKSETGKPGQ